MSKHIAHIYYTTEQASHPHTSTSLNWTPTVAQSDVLARYCGIAEDVDEHGNVFVRMPDGATTWLDRDGFSWDR